MLQLIEGLCMVVMYAMYYKAITRPIIRQQFVSELEIMQDIHNPAKVVTHEHPRGNT